MISGRKGGNEISSSKGDSNIEVQPSFEEGKSPSPPLNNKIQRSQSSQKLETAFKGHIILNPGISSKNYYASLIHTIVAFFNLTTSTTLQPLILLDPASYNVDPGEVGVVLAELILLQTLSKIILTPFYGYLIDNAGRKAMILAGAAITLLGYILVPFQTSIYPGYALSKLLVANGGNILAFIPLNADYINDKTKGKATGISQALSSAGSFLGALFVTVMQALKFSLGQIHIATGTIVMVLVLIYSYWIKGGRYFMVRPGQEANENGITKQDEKFIPKIKKGLNALSSNGWLLISLVISTLARADYYLVTILFALYIKSYDNTIEERNESNHLISLYQDLFFGLGLVGNIVYGFLLDKVNTMKIIFPALGAGLLGYVLILFASSKDSSLILILIISAGLGMPALFNAANYLGIKNFPKDLRGVLSALMNVFGVMGYLFLSTVGGYLFDHTGRSAPFLLFVIMLGASTFAIIFIYYWMILLESKRKKRNKKLLPPQA